MRRLIGISLLTCVVTSAALAGDIPSVDVKSPAPAQPQTLTGDIPSVSEADSTWFDIAYAVLATALAV